MSPIYVFECSNDNCDGHVEKMKSISQHDEPEFCADCGAEMRQVPAPVSKFVRGAGGWSSPA